MPAKKTFDLEKSLHELETLVGKMEDGELALEESLKLFEKGVNLTKQCQEALKNAEQKVKILMKDNKLKDFEIE